MPTVRDKDGRALDVPAESLGQVLASGYTLEGTDEQATRVAAEQRSAEYGGAVGGVAAFGARALGTATGGLSDAAFTALGGRDTLNALREENPGLSTAGSIATAVLPIGIAGAVGRAGAATRALVGDGIGGALAGGAVEGALYGAGEGVSELALSTDPLTVERAASVLSSNALFGAAVGGVAGGAFKGAEIGLGKAKRALDDALAQRAEARALETRAATPPTSITPDTDLATLDRKGLKVAREQELEAVSAAQQPEREAFVGELRAARDASKEEKAWIATTNGKAREVREIGKLTLEADQRVDRLLKNPIELSEQPGKALSALRQQEHALTQLRDWGERETQRYLDEVAGARGKIRTELYDNKVKGYVFGKGALSRESPIVDDIVEREFAARYPQPDRLPTNLQVLSSVPTALERNKALQDRLAKLAEAPSSDRLAQIEAADQALAARAGAPKEEASPVGALLQAAAPFAGPLGAVASAGSSALGGLRKAAGAATERAGKAASRFLDVTGKAAGKAAPRAPAVASKVLSSISYAPKGAGTPPREHAPTKDPLARDYLARANEIQSQIEIAPSGAYQMRQEARLRMASKLDGFRALDPIGADQIETIIARRLEYLASIIPKRPDFGVMPVGPDRHVPSDLEIRGFARIAAALEDPHAVFERAADGRVTPEEAAAIRAVYPELLRHFTDEIAAKLPTLQRTLPYKRRLSLSILTGVPVDPAMTPAILRVLQGMYASEPGTAGGIQAPRAQPQFGSVKRSEPGTASQKREGLT